MKVTVYHKRRMVVVAGKRVNYQFAQKVADKFGYDLVVRIRG